MEEEKFSTMTMYGNKRIFDKRLKEGYTEVALGSGEWVSAPAGSEQRIVKLFVFYHPNGKVATYEHPKANHGFGNIHGQPFEAEYNTKRTLIGKLFGTNSFKDSFENHLKEFKIALGEKGDLAEIVRILGGEQ